MLKFIKGHMATIDHIEIFPLISLTLFLMVFVGWTIYAVRSKSEYIKKMSELPLDNE
jgi:hypothetical protein